MKADFHEKRLLPVGAPLIFSQLLLIRVYPCSSAVPTAFLSFNCFGLNIDITENPCIIKQVKGTIILQ
jgi:hypothetical protein